MNKIFIYLQSDGWKNTIYLIYKTILKKIYYKTTTNFYISEKKHLYSEEQQNIKDLKIKEITIEEVLSLDFPRLKLLDFKKWLDNGSHLYVSFFNNKPIGFIWTHQGSYHIHGLGIFTLHQNEYWSGPTFVHHTLRGRGINKAQIAFQLNQLSDHSVIFTSVNENNNPSIHSYVKYGFKQIGYHNIFIWGRKKKNEIKGEIIKERLILS